MFAYSLRRLLGAIPTLLVLVSLSFFMMRAVPGGPFDTERQLPPEVEANLRAAYHLDEPVYRSSSAAISWASRASTSGRRSNIATTA